MLHRPQNFCGRTHCLVNVCRRVRSGKEAGFKLRGREVNAFTQHSVEEFFETFAVTFHCVGQIMNRFAGEVTAEVAKALAPV